MLYSREDNFSKKKGDERFRRVYIFRIILQIGSILVYRILGKDAILLSLLSAIRKTNKLI